MYFEQFYLGCLAQASYMFGAGGEAVVVDPRRDVDIYIEAARLRGLRIKHVIETHLHADFVSGHLELARRTGACLYVGHAAGVDFPHVAVHDGDRVGVGPLSLTFMETPGHTLESICVLVTDHGGSNTPQKLLTGDTLFIGDVGRPDLVIGRGYSSEQMASMLYDSLRTRILPLSDGVEVYPAHGAGSACGKNISSETSSTLGQQRLVNWALADMGRDEFVRQLTRGVAPPPSYFAHDAELNRRGPAALADLDPLAPLTPEVVEEGLASGASLLDARDASSFGQGHVPGSTNIQLNGEFAPWSGALLDLDAPIILVAPDATSLGEARVRLARVGLERVRGYLQGGVQGWGQQGRPVETVSQMTVGGLRQQLEGAGVLQIVDVRQPGEYANGHVPGAVNLPLASLRERLGQLDPTRPTRVICQGGYRSATAASILKGAGFQLLGNVTGGTASWIQAGFETERPT